MTDRAKSLQRLAGVQKQIVRISEWRVASAERACRELTQDRERLASYVVEDGALGVPLAKAALRSMRGLDERMADAERRRQAGATALAAAKRREHVVDSLADTAATESRRSAERATLAETIETWLVARGTSLP